jgi:RNase P subunit RPR2
MRVSGMIIFCEECGKKHMIEPGEIKTAALVFICSACGEIIRVKMPEDLKKAD